MVHATNGMRVGIIQPNYVPWRGYFDFIDDVDCFVFYDDVPMGTGRKWRNRNLIKTPLGLRWLTVPLKHGQGGLPVHEVAIDYSSNWIDRNLNLLFANYGRTPYWEAYIGAFAEILGREYRYIADLDVDLCRWVIRLLGIETVTVRARDLGISASDMRTRPLLLLHRLGASSYLSGPSAVEYTDASLYAQHSMSLEFKSYDYSIYPQLWGEFLGQVSILDLLFNLGVNARKCLKSRTPNRQPSVIETVAQKHHEAPKQELLDMG